MLTAQFAKIVTGAALGVSPAFVSRASKDKIESKQSVVTACAL